MRKRFAVIIAWALMLVAIAGSGAASAQESPSQGASTDEELVFTVGTVEDMKSISPFKACCTPEFEMMFLVYDLLLNYDKATMEPTAGVAGSWEGNEDSTRWTFKLQPGLKWSDGEPVTSADVKFTYDYVLKNRPNSYTGYLPGDPVITAPDAETIVYETKEPSLAPVSPAWIPILPKHVWGKYEGDIEGAREVRDMPTVGSGPFVLTEWKEAQFWILEKNPYWRGPEPIADKLVFRVYDAPESMVQALKSGEIDFAENIPPPLFDQLISENDPAIQTSEGSENLFINLAFGLWKPNQLGSNGEKPTNHPALLDPTVRVAIAKAIDRQTLVDRIRLGYGSPGSSPVLPSRPYYWDAEAAGDNTQDFDPEAANQMLEDAGYSDADGDGIREMPGGGNPLVFQFLTLNDIGSSNESGEYIKDWLQDIGIKVELKPVSTGKAYDAWYAHDFDAYIWNWGNEPDPDFILSIFSSGQCDNWSDGCYQNPAYDKLYEEQRAATDTQERHAIVDEMQQLLFAEAPEVILFYENDLQAWRKDRWEGFVPQPSPDGQVIYTFGPASYINIRPPAANASGSTEVAESSSSSSTWILIGVAALVIAAIAFVVMKRRRPDEDRE